MNLTIIGFTFDVIGKILLGLSVYFVHGRVVKEMRIDKNVLRAMKRERNLAIIGILLIVLGYLMQLQSKIALES